MVAVPLTPAIERDQEQAGPLEVTQALRPVGITEKGITQWRAELFEYRGASQEPLGLLGYLHQRLAIQVVGHEPVVAGYRQRPCVTVPRNHRGEVEACGPAFRPFGQLRGLLVGHADMSLREDLLSAGRVEGQVTGQQLHRLTGGAQPWQVRLLGTTRSDQLGPRGNPRDDHAEHVVAGR